jgi:tetratricopeptide (TPR) repeat protein
MKKMSLLLCVLILTTISPFKASQGLAGEKDPTIPTRVISTQPPLRWEDAMLSGNGSTGIMVMGLPLEDSIIVNHEKLWTVGNDYRPQTPDLRQAWKKAKEIAQEGRYLDADMYIVDAVNNINKDLYGQQYTGRRPRYDRTHPGFHMFVYTESNGAPIGYRRETNLETGEISVFWTDNRGSWARRVFVSRTHNIIALELTAPTGSAVNASLRLAEAPGKLEGDIEAVDIDHENTEMYFHATYGRRMGKKIPEGYHALARVIVTGGTSRAVANERLEIRGAKRALVLMRLEYLDYATAADRDSLRRALSKLPADYEALLAPHAAVHGEMFHRVTLDLGGRPETIPSSEALIAQALEGRSLAEFFELMHAVGRYALICGATGELAPTLMGLWGNEWDPPWDGRYTFDANLNLAISAASQSNLPEAMATYTSFLELNLEDWRKNAMLLYGCRGTVTDLCQGWRHGAVLMATYPWTGGVGWLASYLYDHYLFTQDKKFLKEHALPMLRGAADFYEDFLKQYPEIDGRYVFYPSISPENVPVMVPADQSTNVVPNATGEISICREVLTNLIAGCRELGTEKENIPRWENILKKLPDYVINQDDALAEWAYPGLGDKYNHRHSSHMYAIYPGLEISPERTPDLFAAARMAMEERLEAGLGNNSAHGLMHVSFVAARLKNARLMWRMLSTFAQLPFVNTSFFTCHNPGPRIYNLDATFSMPAVLTEMLVFSEPGLVELLPALPQDNFTRGTLRGALARGGIVVEELNWNKTLGYVNVTLRSQETQSVKLRFGIDLRFVNAADAKDRELVTGDKPGQWNIDLPAGKSVRLLCRF